MLKTKSYAIQALEDKRFFKLVCGASLTDTKMIEDLSFLFTLGGAHVIDLAPKADVIFAARKGIEKGRNILRTTNYEPRIPLLMVSIQLDKDPHFRKVEVDYNLCDLCGACVKVCPTEAFVIASEPPRFARGKLHERSNPDLLTEMRSGLLRRPGWNSGAPRNDRFQYSTERCYGCGICPSYCHVDALKMIDTNPTPKETLKEMISLGIKSIEFHFGKNYNRIKEIWPDIKELVKNLELVSFSIGSELLSTEEIKKAANLCYELAAQGIILQCDGTPMSGGIKHMGKTGNNTDEKSLEVAKIIEEEDLRVYLQISGGTTENSYMKAINSNININGIAIGSYARKLLMPYLVNKENINDAIKIAKRIVSSVGTCQLIA